MKSVGFSDWLFEPFIHTFWSSVDFACWKNPQCIALWWLKVCGSAIENPFIIKRILLTRTVCVNFYVREWRLQNTSIWLSGADLLYLHRPRRCLCPSQSVTPRLDPSQPHAVTHGTRCLNVCASWVIQAAPVLCCCLVFYEQVTPEHQLTVISIYTHLIWKFSSWIVSFTYVVVIDILYDLHVINVPYGSVY